METTEIFKIRFSCQNFTWAKSRFSKTGKLSCKETITNLYYMYLAFCCIHISADIYQENNLCQSYKVMECSKLYNYIKSESPNIYSMVLNYRVASIFCVSTQQACCFFIVFWITTNEIYHLLNDWKEWVILMLVFHKVQITVRKNEIWSQIMHETSL